LSDEPAPRKKATLGWPFSFAFNRLLAAEPWARARLAPFAGETIELRGPPFPPLHFVILPGGTLEAGGGNPALTITLTPEALVSLARGPEHFARALEVAGDPRLAAEVSALARHLRWDVEEDLSKLFGWKSEVQLTADATNLFGAKLRQYFQFSDATFTQYDPGRTITLGVRAKF